MADKALKDRLQKVYEHFYKASYKSILKSTDFHVPWFFDKKKRLEEFGRDYRCLTLTAFNEAIRNNTAKLTGTPDLELIDYFSKKYLDITTSPIYESYWDVAESEIERNPKDVKPVVTALSTLLMYRLFGPEAGEPNEYILNSSRHQVAVDFQIGTLMFEYYRGVNMVLTGGEKKPEQKPEGNK